MTNTPIFVYNRGLHTYTLDGKVLPSVTHILKHEGFIDDTWFTCDARERGLHVHLACHYHDKETLDIEMLDEVLRPYVMAYAAFKADTGFHVEQSGVPYYHPKYLYAGIPDKINVQTLIDIKTGVADQPWHGLQLAAYGLFFDGPIKTFLVHLSADSSYNVTPYDNPSDKYIFLSALNCYMWKQGGTYEG